MSKLLRLKLSIEVDVENKSQENAINELAQKAIADQRLRSAQVEVDREKEEELET